MAERRPSAPCRGGRSAVRSTSASSRSSSSACGRSRPRPGGRSAFCSLKTWATSPMSRSDGEPPAVGDGDAGRLLPAVLEREEAEVRDARDVTLGRANAEDAAHQLGHLPGLPQCSTGTPRRVAPPTVPMRAATSSILGSRRRSPGRRLRRRARARRPADRAPRRSRLRSRPRRARPPGRPRRRRGRGEQRGARRARETRSSAAFGGEVERRRPAAELTVERLVLGAVERELRLRRRGRSRRPRARCPGSCRTSATRPTQPTTGVGWIARPSVSL